MDVQVRAPAMGQAPVPRQGWGVSCFLLRAREEDREPSRP